MPGAPLLRRTCASAFRRLSRATIAAIDGPPAAKLSTQGIAARASVPSLPLLGASPLASREKASSSWIFCRITRPRPPVLLASPPFGPSPPGQARGLLCPLLTSPPRSRTLPSAQSGIPDAAWISRGKTDRLRRTPAGFTTPTLDGSGLRGHLPARPAG